MQKELLFENPATVIRILGINEVGFEGVPPNAAITALGDIPWCQETAGTNA